MVWELNIGWSWDCKSNAGYFWIFVGGNLAYCPSELVLLMNMMRGINTHIYTMLYNIYIYHISYIHICIYIYIYTYINIYRILPPPKVSCSRLLQSRKLGFPQASTKHGWIAWGALASGTWFPIGSWPFEPSSCGGTQEPSLGVLLSGFLWGEFLCLLVMHMFVYLVWFS